MPLDNVYIRCQRFTRGGVRGSGCKEMVEYVVKKEQDRMNCY